jgi:hypothetical protein
MKLCFSARASSCAEHDDLPGLGEALEHLVTVPTT